MIDGKDHINIYSKGETELGRYLSNFAHTPFNHPLYGGFQSVEGFWYYDLTGKEGLRSLYGYQAKSKGQELCKNVINGEWGVNRPQIKIAILCKLTQNDPELLLEFLDSDLPFRHYYKFGDKIVEPEEGKWIVEFFTELRELLK